MEARITYSQAELTNLELRKFVNEGLQDIQNNNLVSFEATFDELEKRYDAID